MQYYIEHVAVAACATSGVLAARGKRIDLFGVVVLAVTAAVGGGTLRDMILEVPVFWVADPNYVLTAFGIAIAMFLVARARELPGHPLLVADAVGLALFTVIGVEKTLAMGAPESVAIMLGVITGVAGGMLRDVLIREIPMVFRPEIHLYATASFLGASLFIILEHVFPSEPQNRLLAMSLVLGLRLAAIRWKLSLPLFQTNRAGKLKRDME
ncbi:trimeric intracellular cation channel family protein [Desulfonatronum sp. SC1]|uniref:trimeric intracellular cation channel family protein n=1 Tax=Desulfonatronum sp. SC1 TaxID=2109626 RepID=UPI000D31E90A|nr:trimeric intracellular cation channel family protein [Desulfonatronum sp. SC1]PTN32692.1 hypothetical protein C6366_16150 [Desulfonatronum sp. SC1]